MYPKRPEELIDDGSFDRFVREYGELNIRDIPLKAHGKWPHIKELTELLALYRKASKKIPEFLKILPALDKRSLEQCTSEAIAKEKAKLMGSGSRMLNLSGGLGIDDLALSRFYSYIYSIDNNEELNNMVRYNLNKMGLAKHIVRIDFSAEDWLQQNKDALFDCIYADPDRRLGGHKADPAAHGPDVLAMMPDLLRRSPQVWIKFSPLLDTEWLASLKQVSEIWCLALDNEMKEVLVKFEPDYRFQTPVLFGSMHLTDSGIQKFTFSGERAQVLEEEPSGNWIYLPNVALVHSRLSFNHAKQMGLQCISRQGQVFCSQNYVSDFHGRVLYMYHAQPYKASAFSAYLKQNDLLSATIITKGTSLDAVQLRKHHKIKGEGGNILLFTMAKGKEYVLHLSEKKH